MANDFDPAVRNAAMWSGDSRRIATGDACGVVLEKLGRLQREDISDREEVRMGHRMEPVVARIFEDVHSVRLKHLDLPLTHPKHDWLRSHFDYEHEGHDYLVECKNYAGPYAAYFSGPDEPVHLPDQDRAQCLHESIVYGCEYVWLAVLFGGQRYRDYRLYFSPQEKADWLQVLADVWANVQTNTVPPPADPDQARAVFPQSNGAEIVANKELEVLCFQIAQLKARVKRDEDVIEKATAEVMTYMGTHAVLSAVDGKVLATWKSGKSIKSFDKELFARTEPERYNSYCTERPATRRFLVKS